MPQKKVLIIDANSLIHRAFHALPPMNTSKGEMVNAVYGFLLMFFKAAKEFEPDYIAACFDLPGPTERHKKFKEYKAKRVKAPDELYAQIPLVKKALKAFGVPCYEKQGFEADDIIGTIAKLAPRRQVRPQLETIILSGDMDTLGLVNEHTRVYAMRKGLKDTVLYDEKAVQKRLDGLKPEQVADYKGLRGDPSDNIPGVTGIGEKVAIQLLGEFGSLESVYASLDSVKPRTAELLEKYKEQAFLSRDLATINKTVPIEFQLNDLAWSGLRTKKVEDMLRDFGFRTLLKETQGIEEEGDERLERLHDDGVLSDTLYELEKSFAPVLRLMEKTGIKINKKYFAQLKKELTKELGVLEKKIHKLASKPFNIKSPQQLSEVLFDVLELSPKSLKKTPGGAISTASQELEKLQEEHGIIPAVLRYRELQKIYTTYVKPLPKLADAEDRLHTHFDQFGAATGRISSSNPNLQNIPLQGEWGEKVRKGFVASARKIFAAFDYSQMELRIASHVAKDEKMQESFKQGIDIHAITAAEVFGIDLKEVTKEMRFRAKALNFGVLYGMGSRGFAQSAGISFDEAASFIEQYFARFPGIANFIADTIEFAKEYGYTETMFGRKRYIPEINSASPQLQKAAERVAVNHIIQGTAADIIKMAMVHIDKEVLSQEKNVLLLLQIHDELLFEGDSESIKKIEPRVIEIMEQAGK
ncbi:hypothetical protein IIA94_02385, partial [Patescibacteria group bacterium]|nr:hypothetical protein [Patescibacteria group bacterium]